MPKPKELSGMVFGRLTVIKQHDVASNGRRRWLCNCTCGGTTISGTSNLTSGMAKSCGCLSAELSAIRATKHGACKTGAYTSWLKMLTRCTNKNSDKYSYYGGRGITVCDSWLSFESFYKDMGDRPANTSIDRIYNNKGYSKENCRWANRAEQAKNKRSAVLIEHQGKTQCVADWSRELNISRSTIISRARRNVPIDGKPFVNHQGL